MPPPPKILKSGGAQKCSCKHFPWHFSSEKPSYDHLHFTAFEKPLLTVMASDRGQNRYSDFVALKTLLRFENCSSSHCCLRGVGSMSSSRCIPRFIVLFSSSHCLLSS